MAVHELASPWLSGRLVEHYDGTGTMPNRTFGTSREFAHQLRTADAHVAAWKHRSYRAIDGQGVACTEPGCGWGMGVIEREKETFDWDERCVHCGGHLILDPACGVIHQSAQDQFRENRD